MLELEHLGTWLRTLQFCKILLKFVFHLLESNTVAIQFSTSGHKCLCFVLDQLFDEVIVQFKFGENDLFVLMNYWHLKNCKEKNPIFFFSGIDFALRLVQYLTTCSSIFSFHCSFTFYRCVCTFFYYLKKRKQRILIFFNIIYNYR